MECLLCGYDKVHKHGKTSKGSQWYYCPHCRQTFTDTFDTIHYRRQVKPEQIRTVLQAHSEGSSLRGVERTSGLAYRTVVNLVRYAGSKAQLIHNAQVESIGTTSLSGDEFWSYVQKNRRNAN
jgi:transposase-like protein